MGTEGKSSIAVIFRYINWIDILLMSFGTVGAIGDGMFTNWLLVFASHLMNSLGYGSTKKNHGNFMDEVEKSDLVESDPVTMAEGPNATGPAQVLALHVGGPPVNPRPLNTRTRLDQLEEKMHVLSGIIDQVTTLEERLDSFSDDQDHMGERLVSLEGVVEGNMATLLDQMAELSSKKVVVGVGQAKGKFYGSDANIWKLFLGRKLGSLIHKKQLLQRLSKVYPKILHSYKRTRIFCLLFMETLVSSFALTDFANNPWSDLWQISYRTIVGKYSAILDTTVKLGIKQGIAKGLAVGSTGLSFAIWAFIAWYGSRLVMYEGESGGRIYAAGISFILCGLSPGMALPDIKYFTEASVAATRIFKRIDRIPQIDGEDRKKGLVLDQVSRELEFDHVIFTYPP
ncbi:hypothetical protein GIB67_003138 [Kingdonia uniflora]|uniref:Uncharacterized protein n=1 Tax=Kingdonia uniflora TaxID=39325 RepID=A0A7J7N6C2_9MAGN|nr:hypothetical protein GIB67_003138 [Kingdonia uniflora]